MGQYDRTMKLLVDSNPEAMARFVLHEWQKQQGIDLPEPAITSVKQLSSEFQGEELDGDGVWLLEGPDGPLYLVEVEYQSSLDPTMPLRSLEYLARARKKHWKICGKLPVIAAVVYLFHNRDMPVPPLTWPGPGEQTVMAFHYLSINMKDLSREDLLALREPELWPLVLLTKGGVDRIIVKTMFAELLEQKLYQTLPIGQIIAAWFMRGEDLIWLHKEYRKMFDLFKDSPAIQWLEESFTAEALKKAEQHAQQELQQQLREAEKHAQQQLRDEQKKNAVALHKVVIELVSQHFPTLKGLARAQVRMLEKPEEVQELLLHLLQAHETNEAQEILLRLNSEEEDEEAAN